LHTIQIGWNEKLKDLMVWDGIDSIVFHSTPFIFCKSKQWNLITYHSIPSHATNPNIVFILWTSISWNMPLCK